MVKFKRTKMKLTILSIICVMLIAGCNEAMTEGNSMIRHTVVFRLKHPAGSPEEASFLSAARNLASIPGVENFECLRQVSSKNDFTFGLSMEFASQKEYDVYNNHPDHADFVQVRWIPEVADFLEIDYTLMSE